MSSNCVKKIFLGHIFIKIFKILNVREFLFIINGSQNKCWSSQKRLII